MSDASLIGRLSTSSSSASIWAIGVVVLVAVPVFGGGSIVAFEVFAVVFGWSAFIRIARHSSVLRWTWLLALLWASAQVVSNLSHAQYNLSSLMYVGPMIATIATGLYWVRRRAGLSVPAVLISFGLGWLILDVVFLGILSASSNPWKYGLSLPVAIIVLAAASRVNVGRISMILLLMLLAVVSLVFDSRLQTALFLVCALATWLTSAGTNSQEKGKGILAIVGIASIVAGVYWIYPSAALSGSLGDRAYRQQVSYESDGSNYVLATRKEFPQIAYLVSQNPILGIGSYAPLDRTQRADALEFVDKYVAHLTPLDRTYLTSSATTNVGYRAHSAAMSSALFAGVLTLPFWVFLLVQNMRGVRRFARGSAVVAPLALYFFLLSTWDSFFSPINNVTHLSIGVTLYLVAEVLDPSDES